MDKVGIKVKMLDDELHFIALDDIIFIQVDRKVCSFYLKNETPQAIIKLIEVWDMIKKAAMGQEHHLMKVGREYIINMDCYVKNDPSRNIVILRRDSYTTTASEIVKKNKREIPKNLMPHVQALKELQGNTDSDKKQGSEIIEVPMKYFEVPVGEAPMKELLKKKEKWFGVLDNYALLKELTVDIDELNDKHFTEAGHEYVDLGLESRTLWATQNLNQISYFAWGELYENDVYDETEYIHKKGVSNIIDPTTSVLSIEHDAAHHSWRGGWRMPTKKECEELINSCTLNWCITKKKVHGCLLTGPNNNRIFLPAKGYRIGTSIQGYEKFCYYWSSSNGEFDRPEAIKILEYEGDELEIDRWVTPVDPYLGLPIRPVISKDGLTGQEGKLKRMLILDDYFANDDDIIMQGFDSIMDGWDIRRITLPVDYDEAAKMIVNVLKTFDPEVIVAFKSACFWGQKIKGRIKFLVEPARKISEAMKYYMEVEQEGLEEKNWLVTRHMIDFYVSEEEKLTQKKQGGDCWVLTEEPMDIDDPQFDGCNSVELLPPNDLSRWTDTWLFPIVREVTDRQNRNQTDEKTLYERKFNI